MTQVIAQPKARQRTAQAHQGGDHRRAPSRPNAVHEAILDLIFRGKLISGEATSEDQICALLERPDQPAPSRTPVRLALAVLEAQGFVVKRPQVGCFIVPVERDELEEITDLRIGIEQRVFAALASTHPASGNASATTGVTPPTFASANDSDELWLSERDFHADAAQQANFTAGASTIRLWGDRLRVYNADCLRQNGRPAITGSDWARLDAAHEQLETAVAEESSSLARDLVTAHLEQLGEALLSS